MLFEKFTNLYARLLRLIVKQILLTFMLLVGFSVGIFFITSSLQTGFIPSENQGMIYAIIQTPPGSTLERTNDITKKLQKIAEKVEGIQSISALAGYEVLTEGRGSNAGTCLINLKP